MHWIRTPAGAATAVLLSLASLLLGVVGLRVWLVTRPAPVQGAPIDLEAMRLDARDVEFPAADGSTVRGWLLPGDGATPPLILCHDLGRNKQSLLNLAIHLQQAGFPVLLFDFRGHGSSSPAPSSLGVREKRDVTGAVDFLQERVGLTADRVGVFGVGMGAHAAVLAAADRREIRVVVLDGLYPAPSYSLSRQVLLDLGGAERRLDFLPGAMFAVLQGDTPDRQRAADAIAGLRGRHVLLLAPAGDSDLVGAMQTMYESIPDQVDADGNLVLLPATLLGGLHGDGLARYHERVREFFVSRLLVRPERPGT